MKTKKEFKETGACQICEGKCCKRLPGSYSPKDIKKFFPAKDLRSSVRLALKTGKIAIDWWEGDKPIYFLRPSVKGKEGIISDPSWGGECIYLKKNGCELRFEKRPEGCRRLEPRKGGGIKCISHFEGNPKLVVAELWLKSKANLGRFLEGGE